MKSTDVQGVLAVDKPAGMTSHDVVAVVRRLYRLRRVGHTGTLDPAATGLLLLCLGSATKAARWLVAGEKTYDATIHLGIETTTGDAEGEIVSQRDASGVMPQEVEAALGAFTGAIDQIVPAYSAIRRGGRRLHEIARQGGRTPEVSRSVTVHKLELLAYEPPLLTIRLRCSQGTYVRSIAQELGTSLGCGGHLAALRRLAVGRTHVDSSVSLADIQTASMEDRWSMVRPLAGFLPGHRFEVTRQFSREVHFGRTPTRSDIVADDDALDDVERGECIALVDARGSILAIGNSTTNWQETLTDSAESNPPLPFAYHRVLVTSTNSEAPREQHDHPRTGRVATSLQTDGSSATSVQFAG